MCLNIYGHGVLYCSPRSVLLLAANYGFVILGDSFYHCIKCERCMWKKLHWSVSMSKFSSWSTESDVFYFKSWSILYCHFTCVVNTILVTKPSGIWSGWHHNDKFFLTYQMSRITWKCRFEKNFRQPVTYCNRIKEYVEFWLRGSSEACCNFTRICCGLMKPYLTQTVDFTMCMYNSFWVILWIFFTN